MRVPTTTAPTTKAQVIYIHPSGRSLGWDVPISTEAIFLRRTCPKPTIRSEILLWSHPGSTLCLHCLRNQVQSTLFSPDNQFYLFSYPSRGFSCKHMQIKNICISVVFFCLLAYIKGTHSCSIPFFSLHLSWKSFQITTRRASSFCFFF